MTSSPSGNRYLDDDGKLVLRAEQFCREYIIDFSGQRAATRAGYPEKSARIRASEMLSLPAVQDRVAELMAERAKRTQIDADWTLQKLKLVADRCTDSATFDAAGANRALQLIGMHQGIFEADNRQRQPRTEQERIAAVDAEIEEMMARGDPRNGAATRH